MESQKIKMLCDADYCNCSAGRRSRETTTIAECEQLYRQANEKGDVGNARNETDEDLSAATLDQIISKCEEVYQRWEELCELSDPENFCEGCEHRRTVREREEYWGSACYRVFESCRAELNPDDGDCPYTDDFTAYVQEKEECQAMLDRLDALQEKLEEEVS